MVTHLSPSFNYAEAEYEFLPCNFCGGGDFRLLAKRDQNGLPVETRLCRRCGLIAVNPRMKPEWYLRYYEREYRNQRAAMKGGSSGYLGPELLFEKAERFGRNFARLVRTYVRPGLTIEVGSSAGGLLTGFAGEIRSIRPLGIEPSPAEALYAKQRGIPTVVSSFERLMESFDPAANIICARTLNHLMDPKRFLTWAHEALEPDGKLILAVLDFRFSCERRGIPERAIQIDHVFMFVPETLEAFVRVAGFEIEFFQVPGRLTRAEFAAMRAEGLTGQHMRLVARRTERVPFADLGPAETLGERVSRTFSRPRFFTVAIRHRGGRLARRLRRAPAKAFRILTGWK